jgi:signal transduction histidine kinase/ligand-binding sensor domain-containing protein/DNA-binding response OmpR family regulator
LVSDFKSVADLLLPEKTRILKTAAFVLFSHNITGGSMNKLIAYAKYGREMNVFTGFRRFHLTFHSYVLASLLISILPGSTQGQGNTFVFEHFTQESGLSNNQVQYIFQDLRGFMWFGTSQGLSRFDGYRFRIFENDPADSTSLRGNLVRSVFQHSNGELYVGTENGGLNHFNRNTEQFSHPFDRFPEFRTASVNCIAEGEKGKLWMGTEDGLLTYAADGSVERVLPENLNTSQSFDGNYVRVLTFGPDGTLWMGTNNGVFVLDTANNEILNLDLPLPGSMNAEIWELVRGVEGKMWIGTYDNGAFLLDQSGEIELHFIPDPQNERSRTVRSIAPDKNGNYWIGTRGGVFIYRHGEGLTGSYTHDERESKSLSGNSVLSIFHDAKGDTWIGTRSGISFLVHSKQVFRSFRAMPGDNRYLNSKELYAFWLAPDDNLWIGTEDGGVNIYNPATKIFSFLMHDPRNPETVSSDCIKAFMDDGKGNIWVGTFRGGISVVNQRSRKSIRHYRHEPENRNSLGDDRVWGLLRDKRGTIWVATSAGIEHFNPANETFSRLNILSENTQVNWIREDSDGDLWIGARDEIVVYSTESGVISRFKEYTRDFLEDSKGRFWIATLNKGLANYSKTDGPLRYFTEKEGLANNQALCVLEDNNRFQWISTTHGLSRFNPETGFFESFTARDGLQNDQFTYGASLKLPNGDLVFGGIAGFNIFNPLEVRTNDFAAPIVLTDLRLFNRSVAIGNSKNSILSRSIVETEEITIPFHQNVVSVEFAALNYVNSQGNLYSYYLEGFDKAWNDPSPNRLATYTNLDPGQYTLHIKSFIPGIPDAGKGTTLTIHILPPYWKTWWFKILFTLFIAAIIAALIQFMVTREKLKNELVLERMKAKKLHELDMLKLRFFTNLSHEIRTPLTLIMGPLEKIMNSQVATGEMPPLLEIMHRNARQLNSLINQILDFRKLETGNLKLNFTDGDLVGFLRNIVDSFTHLALEKEIELKFNSVSGQITARFDPDKLEKIVNNLLSNAFKYTGKEGRIVVNLSVVFDGEKPGMEGESGERRFINISVIDTGIGIPEKHVNKIFNRFFQSDEQSDLPGTGIGLALARELVKLHNGEIFVTSKPGKGSKFTVSLPFIEPLSKIIDEPEGVGNPCGKEAESENEVPGQNELAGMQVMLIAEDNADVRKFIRLHFESSYYIVETTHGEEAWEQSLITVPDIILSDVMMPMLNGYELLKRLKNDERTSHIPVILLTALGSKEHEMEGLAIGADDYITKPFDIAILQTKIENILSIRKALKQKYSGELMLQPKNILVSAPDERFLKRAIDAVEESIADSDLDIERFAQAVGVSRMQLYRKLHALTDMTVKEFIRNIRLKRAAQLLLQNRQNISEIAYAVGFKDLSHFRKCFRQEFGMSASEYAESNAGKINPEIQGETEE